MHAADMFIHSILELWGMSEELPCIYAPWGQQWFDWCFAQALKRRKDFIAVLEKLQKKSCPFAIAQRRAETGAESVEVISPSDTTPNLECKIVRLLEACWRYNNISSVELQSIGIFPKAIRSHVELIRDMRFGGRKMTFIGLANTLLDDSHALLIAGALRSQMILAPGEEPETLEMHQMVFPSSSRDPY